MSLLTDEPNLTYCCQSLSKNLPYQSYLQSVATDVFPCLKLEIIQKHKVTIIQSKISAESKHVEL